MSKLDEMLASMDVDLFEDSDDEYAEVRTEGESEVTNETPAVYQEDIPNSVAKELLSEDDYDEECHYQLVHAIDDTVVVKIDDRISVEEEQAALDADPETTHLHMREISISSENDVVSYADMQRSYVGAGTQFKGTSIFARPELLDYDIVPHRNWPIIIVTSVITILILIGILLFFVTVKYLT